MRTDRKEFLGVQFDLLSQSEVLRRLSQLTSDSDYSYVVTPNVDHLVRIHESEDALNSLLPLYRNAKMCLCDSKVLHLIAALRGISLPVVPGSTLTSSVFERVIRPGDRIAIVGGDNELLRRMRLRYPKVEFVHHRPPMGLRSKPDARRQAAKFIAESDARFAFLAVGSPQQEMIAAEVQGNPQAKGTVLCIGASLEFLTGLTKRAPRFMQRLSLEWAHRLFSDPKRFWRRYLLEGPKIFLIAGRWSAPDSNGVVAK